MCDLAMARSGSDKGEWWRGWHTSSGELVWTPPKPGVCQEMQGVYVWREDAVGVWAGDVGQRGTPMPYVPPCRSVLDTSTLR